MPEVINKQRGGINVSGLEAKEVSAIQQAGPLDASAGFLESLAGFASNAVDVIGNSGKADAAARVGRAEDETALANEEISRGFINVAEKSRAQEVGELSERIYNEELDPTEKAALGQAEAFEKRASAALAQGVRPEAAIALERSRLRTQLIQKYPGLSKEILAVSTTSNALNKEALEVEFEDDKAERARLQAQDTMIAEKLSAFGVDVSTSTAVQRRRVWNETLGPHYQRLGTYKTETELLEADESLDAAKKKIARRAGLDNIADSAVLTLNNEIVAAIDSAPDANAALIAASTLISQREAEARSLAGNVTESEFQSGHGFIFGPARALLNDLVANKTDAVSGKTSLDQAKHKADLQQILSENAFYERNKGFRDVKITNEILGPVSDALMKSNTARVALSNMLTKAITAASDGLDVSAHVPTTTPVTADVNTRLSEAKATRDVAVDLIITNGANQPAKIKKAAVDQVLSRLSEKENYNGYAGVMGVLDLTASKQFLEEAKKITGKDEYISTMTSFGLNLLKDPEGLFEQYDKDYDMDITADGKVKLKYIGKVPPAAQKRMEKYAVQLGQAIRTVAHLSDSEDYVNAAIGFFETDVRLRESSRGVQR